MALVVLAVLVDHQKAEAEVVELEVDQAEDRAEDREEGQEDHYASLECLEMNHEGYRARPDLYLEAGIDPCRMLPSAEMVKANECVSVGG